MDKYEFDQENLWHTNADLLFGFMCQYCDAEICFDDVSECSNTLDYGEWCVIISNEAQRLGWKLVEEFTFACPRCSKKKGL